MANLHDTAKGWAPMALTDQEIAIVKGMLIRGDAQHHIASYFGENSARIAEVKKGERGPNVAAAPQSTLPPPGPYMAGRSAIKARETLLALRDLIDGAINDIDRYERAADEAGTGGDDSSS